MGADPSNTTGRDIRENVAVRIGLLHPGEMGAAVGAVLRARGETVLWASQARSAQTARRAEEAGLEDAGTVAELSRRSEMILSVCPPHAALAVAQSVAGFSGVFVDANAVAPASARAIARTVGRCVDGGIIGAPPREPGETRLFLSGAHAPEVAELFSGTIVRSIVVSGEIGAASAVKMAFAAWTKGSAALLLGARALARAEGVEKELLETWRWASPELPDRSAAASRSALGKGWRWVGEMNEIADTFAAAGLPDGFHRAAAEVYRRSSTESSAGADSLDRVLNALLQP